MDKIIKFLSDTIATSGVGEIAELIAGIVIGAVIVLLLFLLKRHKIPLEVKEKIYFLEAENKELSLQASVMDKSKSIAIDRLNRASEHDEVQSKKISMLESKNELQTKRIAESNASLFNLQEKLATQKSELEEIQKKFQVEFENIANKVLDEKSVKFTAQNKENIHNILSPLSDKLKSFEQKVQDTYEKGLRDRSELKEQVVQLSALNQNLSKDAQNLTNALTHDTKLQGNWGEFILEKILEESGLTKGQEYKTQFSTTDEDNKRIQPDVVIFLPDNKHVIIDSKVSLVGYEAFVNSENKAAKEQHLASHLLSIRTHIKGLSEKNYQLGKNINSPDFVLLFMPIEPAFSVAMQQDQEIYSYAWKRNIVIVSPTTLFATLRTISSIWKQEKQNKNTQEIARQAAALYEKFVGFLSDMEKIEKGIINIDSAYKSAINKLQSGSGNLIHSTEKIRKLGLNTKKKIPDKFIAVESHSE